MADPPRGRPPSTASPPPPQRGQRALTFLGGGVLVLAVAGGAWALFGRDTSTKTSAVRPATSTSATQKPAGPVVPGISVKTTPSKGPVATATPSAVATASPKPAPTKALVATPSPKPTTSPAPAPVTKPPVTGPQQGGTVAKKAFTFKVARGDTLWDLTKTALRSTGRSTSNANVAAYVTKLYQANRATIGSDPDLILIGDTITWPASL
ncbi:MAG: hypothetical protein ABR549_19905 [Mycobacteriales bacterium]